jgi:hypothetical protein
MASSGRVKLRSSARLRRLGPWFFGTWIRGHHRSSLRWHHQSRVRSGCRIRACRHSSVAADFFADWATTGPGPGESATPGVATMGRAIRWFLASSLVTPPGRATAGRTYRIAPGHRSPLSEHSRHGRNRGHITGLILVGVIGLDLDAPHHIGPARNTVECKWFSNRYRFHSPHPRAPQTKPSPHP